MPSTCAETGCTQTVAPSWGSLWCAMHDEEHLIVFELMRDAADAAHTQVVHELTVGAIDKRLQHFVARDDVGDLANINAARAALLAANAALGALEDGGHLVPEGARTERRYQVAADGEPVTELLTPDGFEAWMKQNTLPASHDVLVHRTIVTTIPRLLPAAFIETAAPAEPVPEDAF
jgi:hypothetical protein